MAFALRVAAAILFAIGVHEGSIRLTNAGLCCFAISFALTR
jgi:hypothetical protein